MTTDTNNTNHILAEEGMVLIRKSDNMIFGEEIYLGYTYYLGGELLPEPLLELPEHYEEIRNKAPFWDMTDEEFESKIASGELVFNEEMKRWDLVPLDPEFTPFEELN